jgi:Acyl-CoA carboxylase epsilon subunit
VTGRERSDTVTAEDSVHAPRPVLFTVKGDASPEEVAALVAVLQGLAASATSPAKPPRSEWASPHRAVRASHASGSAGWRSSSLPR